MSYAWLDMAPLPAGVLRKGRYVYANAALLRLLGYTAEEFFALRAGEWVAVDDRDRVLNLLSRRLHGEGVPDTYELAVLRKDGEHSRVEAFIARHGEDVVFQLRDQTQRALHQGHVQALARLGASLQAHHGHEEIFRALADGLSKLDTVQIRCAPAGERVRVVGIAGPEATMTLLDAYEDGIQRGMVREWSPGMLRAWKEGIAYVDDMPASVQRFFGGDAGAHLADAMRTAGHHQGLVVRVDIGGDPTQLLVILASWIRAEDEPAFTLFATQISAALTAARAIADLSLRNNELAALNRVATASGTVSQLETLFAFGTEELARTIGCDVASIYLLEESRREVVLAYSHGAPADLAPKFSRVSLDGTMIGEALTTGVPQVWHPGERIAEDEGVIDPLHQRLVVSVPLLVRSEPVGVMNVTYREERRLPSHEIEILQAAAAHFAAAIDTSRLVQDLRQSYADLARTQEQLVQRERLAALGELSAAVAHEVRNPLGVIFNSLGSMRKLDAVRDKERMEVLLSIAQEEAQRINHIVGDLLDFARPAMPNLQTSDLRAVVADALNAAAADSTPRLSVVRHFDDDTDGVSMDTRLMRQAFLNVASNAIQSMNGVGTLTVRVYRRPLAEGGGVCVEFGDTGSGISPEHVEKIFEPFFTTRATGTGLGLAVVKRIVEGHRGIIEVDSEPGRGTRFRIVLPHADIEGPSEAMSA